MENDGLVALPLKNIITLKFGNNVILDGEINSYHFIVCTWYIHYSINLDSQRNRKLTFISSEETITRWILERS